MIAFDRSVCRSGSCISNTIRSAPFNKIFSSFSFCRPSYLSCQTPSSFYFTLDAAFAVTRSISKTKYLMMNYLIHKSLHLLLTYSIAFEPGVFQKCLRQGIYSNGFRLLFLKIITTMILLFLLHLNAEHHRHHKNSINIV